MKARLNITIDEALIPLAKNYASKANTSVSELIESYIKQITKPAKRKTIVDLIRERPKRKPKFDVNADLKKLYYEEQAKKYGF